MTTGAQVAIDDQNPWPGLAAFDETAERFFNGRSTESAELRRLVLNASMTVLFGASGLGKTSLVQAGLFPLLRKGNTLPVYVRLDVRDRNAPLIEQVKQRLQSEVHARNVDASAFSGRESLWQYLHRAGLELWSDQNQLLTPLFVFDQFEEVFTLGAENLSAIQRLRIDLADLIENRIPTNLAAQEVTGLALDSQRYRVLVSFREDYLPSFESWKRELPSIMRNRLWLQPMSGDQAFEAVHTTAPHLADEEMARRIVRFVAAAEEEGATEPELREIVVEPALLSLVCSGLNEKRKAQGKRAFDEGLLRGTGTSIISDYYRAAVRDMPERVEHFIQNELITEGGLRKPCDVNDARSVHGMKPEELRLLVDRRLFRIEPRHRTEWVELIHDRLTGVVRADREKRRKKERAKQQGKRAGLVAGALVLLLLAGLVILFGRLYREANKQRVLAEIAGRLAQQQTSIAKGEKNAADVARTDAEKARAAAESSATAEKQQREIAEKQRSLAEQQRKLAEQQSVRADQAAREALTQARIASAGRLAVAALLNKDVQLDLASLLSLEAGRTVDSFEARNALFSVFQSSPNLIAHLHHSSPVRRITISPDGKLLAAGTSDGNIWLWDLSGRKTTGMLSSGANSALTDITFSSDGKLLASANDNDMIRVWNVQDHSTRNVFHGTLPIAFSPDGKSLATGDTDYAVRLWKIAKPPLESEVLSRHLEAIGSLAFSPDGTNLVSTSGRTIAFWDIPGHKASNSMTGAAVITGVAFSPNGKVFVSASVDQTMSIWDATTRSAIGAPLIQATPITAIVLSSDAKTIASGAADGNLQLWDIATQKPIGPPVGRHTGAVSSLAFSPDGKTLASAGGEPNVRLWDVANRYPFVECLKGHSGEVRSVAFSPNGKILASGSRDHTIQFWNLADRTPIGKPIEAHADSVQSVAFSPDGKILASASSDRTVKLWDASSHQQVGPTLSGHTNSVNGLSFSPDGKVLASASADFTIRLWDVARRQLSGEPLKKHTNYLWTVAFSPDGRMLTSASYDKTVLLWNVASRQPIGEPFRVRPDSAIFSPDGKLLAVSSEDKTILLWDVQTHQPSGEPLKGHTGEVQSSAFSPDGKMLASGSDDSTVRLWDLESRQALGQPLTGHGSGIWSVAFSPDGKTVASAGRDQIVRLWNVDPSAWADRACRVANRNLSLSEWLQYMGPKVPYRRTCPDLPDGEGVSKK